MDISSYPVSMEVAGSFAMFARPDTGGTPTSYPIPTLSASKGIFESIAFFSDGRAWILPTKVEICRPVGERGQRLRFQAYTTNYGGPLRKNSLFNAGVAPGGSSMQLHATVLTDVCYRLYGAVVGPRARNRGNPRHHLQELFLRRLKHGQCYRSPCLGWSEFTCSYWGAFRDGVTEVDTSFDVKIPSMLTTVFNAPNGDYRPSFQQDVCVSAGAFTYSAPAEWNPLPEERDAE